MKACLVQYVYDNLEKSTHCTMDGCYLLCDSLSKQVDKKKLVELCGIHGHY